MNKREKKNIRNLSTQGNPKQSVKLTAFLYEFPEELSNIHRKLLLFEIIKLCKLIMEKEISTGNKNDFISEICSEKDMVISTPNFDGFITSFTQKDYIKYGLIATMRNDFIDIIEITKSKTKPAKYRITDGYDEVYEDYNKFEVESYIMIIHRDLCNFAKSKGISFKSKVHYGYIIS